MRRGLRPGPFRGGRPGGGVTGEDEAPDEYCTSEAPRLGHTLTCRVTAVLKVFRQLSPDLRGVAHFGKCRRSQGRGDLADCECGAAQGAEGPVDAGPRAVVELSR